MKKILLLITFIMPLFFASCGDDDDSPSTFSKQLIGEWVEYNGNEIELFHYKFDSDHKGLFWVTEYGEVIEEISFSWSTKGDVLSFTINDDYETYTGKGFIKDGLLCIYNEDDEGDEDSYIYYKKVK